MDPFDLEYWAEEIRRASSLIAESDKGALCWASKENKTSHAKCLKTARQVDQIYGEKDPKKMKAAIEVMFSAHRELIIAHRKSYKEVQR